MSVLLAGTSTRFSYKKETAGAGWSVLPGASGATQLRRSSFSISVSKETAESAEIRGDRQVAVFSHQNRTVESTLEGEISGGSYAPFMGSILARDFTVGVATVAMTLTIATTASPRVFTFTRSAGSYLTDGIKVGDVMSFAGGTLNAANAGNNVLVAALTATVLTGVQLSSTNFVADAAVASVTGTVRGKKTFIPSTGHTDDSYSIEAFYSDLTPAQAEVYTGMKVNSMQITCPNNGFATVSFGFLGRDIGYTGTTAYFTSPTPASVTPVVSGVNGAVVVNGVVQALITSFNFTVDREAEAAMVVGSVNASDIFTGTIGVTGDIEVYFNDPTYRDFFLNETEVSLVLALSAGRDKASDVISFAMPRCKLNGADKADAELGVMQSMPFVALLQGTNALGLEASTIAIQDTAA